MKSAPFSLEERVTIAADRVFETLRHVEHSPDPADARVFVVAAVARLHEYDAILYLLERSARELGVERKSLGALAAHRAIVEKGRKAGRPSLASLVVRI